ncbi:hypothetical protein [Nocardioides sp.]|uniref:hypothetical protein n=1 Tax=Nocardioides sp. TaxID=35761 RepID=UPI0035193FD8
MSTEKPPTIPRSRATRHFFTADDLELIEEAAHKLEVVKAKAALRERRAGGADLEDPTIIEAQAEFDAVHAEVTARAVLSVTVQALKASAYQDLLAQCPPTEADKEAGQPFNERKLTDLLLTYFDGETGERTIVEPDFRSREALVEWLSEFQFGDRETLFAAALSVNEGHRGLAGPKASRT